MSADRRKGGVAAGLEFGKSIRVGQRTGKTSVGMSQQDRMEVLP